MSLQPIRLPRLVESDPRGEQILRILNDRAGPIRDGSEISVSAAPFTGLQSTLQATHRAGRVVRGLDTAKQTLAAEERGLRMADEKSGAKRGGRVSRLLLLADDGSDGFYRKVETLLGRHAPRVLAIRLDVGAEALGAALFGEGRATRLVMIQHKEAVADVLLALADPA